VTWRGLEGQDGSIRLRLAIPPEATPQREAYRLDVDPVAGVDIVGTDAAGAFYGIQSLLAMLTGPAGFESGGGIPVMRGPRSGPCGRGPVTWPSRGGRRTHRCVCFTSAATRCLTAHGSNRPRASACGRARAVSVGRR
jgi:hypothetical protein